jgi:hypothetical protein
MKPMSGTVNSTLYIELYYENDLTPIFFITTSLDFFKLTLGESWAEELEEGGGDIEVGSSSSSESRTITPSTADANSGGGFLHLDEDDDFYDDNAIQRAFNNADTLH